MKTRYSRSYLLLFAQLLVCLFVSSLTITSSNAFADINRTWTENNIKNAIYNYRHSKGQSDSQIESYINTNASYITTVTNAFNSYKYVTILYQTSGSLSNMCFLVSNGDGKWYLNSSKNRLSSTNNSDSKNWIFPSSGTAWQVNGWQDNFFNINYYYTSKDIYSASNSNTVILQANSSIPSDLITSPHVDYIPLTFFIRSSDTIADVWVYEDVPVYSFSGDEDLYIGQLYQPLTYQGYETNNNFFYMWGNWQYRDLTSYCTYTEYVGSDEHGSLYDVYLDKSYFYTNTLYNLVWTDTSTDPYSLAAANFYLRDENTVIIDGVIDPSKTFSGDYKDQYDYENDPNENFWRNTYNRLMTPSGEVLRDTITSLMSDLDFSASGDESGELMMALAGLDVISNDFGDFIISWNDFSPNLTIKGQSVSSSGPFIPAGQINFSQMERNNETFHDIMQYTRAILSFSVIVLFFNNLWHTLLITLGISTQIYEKDQLAKEKLSRQAERDQRRQEREDRQRYQQWLYEHRR